MSKFIKHNVLDGTFSELVVTAKVLSVSADSLQDEMTGMFYFLARVQLEQKELEKLSSKITLNPGMPAQVFIMTGSRSLMRYLMLVLPRSCCGLNPYGYSRLKETSLMASTMLSSPKKLRCHMLKSVNSSNVSHLFFVNTRSHSNLLCVKQICTAILCQCW